MDWDESLFAFLDDLEQQAEALYDADRAGELADRSRSEYAEVCLAGRLLASVDTEVTLDLVGVGPVGGVLQRVGPDWCLVHGATQDWVIPLAAVAAVVGASPRSVPEVAWSPVDRLRLGSALRRLADTAAPCRVHATDGSIREGVLVRVGRDFVEVRTAREQVALFALGAVAAVQSRS